MDDSPVTADASRGPEISLGGNVRRVAPLDRAALEALDAAGVLDRLGKVELIEGVLVRMSPSKSPHGDVLIRLGGVMDRLFSDSFVVGGDIGIVVTEETVRAPDIVVRRKGTRPGWLEPADVLLAVEIADSTIEKDLGGKAVLYGGAGVSEYWVVDLGGRTLTVHRIPSRRGYEEIRRLDWTQSAKPVFAPDTALVLADILDGIV